jgi:hypothetical protein
MRPGEDCIGCHSAGEGPDFEIAGTVMPAYDEPSDCKGVDGVTVRVTDATGHVKTLLTNAAGNFYTLDPIVPPYTVELDAGGVTSQIYSPQTETDCMVCHTATGKNGAPGRIVAPG